MRVETTLVFLSLVAVALEASTRSEREQMRIAEQVLTGAVGTRSYGHQLQIIESRDMFTVIGNAEKGFAVIANDDSFPAVIGFSTKPFAILPPAVKWYLTAVELSLKGLADEGSSYVPIPPSTEFPATIGPLLATTWDQGSPFNRFCPGGNGGVNRLYPTGCVATALSQIMNYHQYPEAGIGEHQYSFQPAAGDGRILSANFGKTRYDWANMLDNYSKVSYSDEQADAVATLMLHCGVAVDMNYSANGSGAYSQEACLGVKKYFGYNKNARIYTRDFYPVDQWMRMVYTELHAQRPIYYSGVSERQGGHAFVIDGYDVNGLVHVNWGWGGSADGYYDIALLNPSSYQFSLGQDMILGMCDSTVNIPYESQIVAPQMTFNFYGVSSKRVSINGYIYNAGAEKFVGRIACILENADTTIVLKSQEDLTLQPIMGGYYRYTSLSLNSNNLSSIPDGTYNLFVGSLSSQDMRWQMVRPYENEIGCYAIIKSSNDVVWTEITSSVQINVKVPKQDVPLFYDLQGRKIGGAARGTVIMKQGGIVKKVVLH